VPPIPHGVRERSAAHTSWCEGEECRPYLMV